jgi:hypothetical protein
MMHGALVELNSAEAAQRAEVSQTVSRIFLRSSVVGGQGAAKTDQPRNDG